MNIGILGGGQLAKMLIEQNQSHKFFVYSDTALPSIKDIATLEIGQLDNFDKLKNFIDHCDVITFENENIDTSVLNFLIEHARKKVFPNPSIISAFQDRIREKNYFKRLNVPTNEYAEINSKEDAIRVFHTMNTKLVLKKRVNTYDGKGQHVITKLEKLYSLADEVFHHAIIEEFIPFDAELSLTGCRDQYGNMTFYDISINTAHKGILRVSQNAPNHPLLPLAKSHLEKLMSEVLYVGTCTIEFFQKDGRLIANEFSPRVHNSAHWTIDATLNSQFQTHIQCITGKKINEQHINSQTNAVMINVIGQFPTVNIPTNVTLYDYEKKARPNRKLGHITICKNDFNNTANYEKTLKKFIEDVGDVS